MSRALTREEKKYRRKREREDRKFAEYPKVGSIFFTLFFLYFCLYFSSPLHQNKCWISEPKSMQILYERVKWKSSFFFLFRLPKINFTFSYYIIQMLRFKNNKWHVMLTFDFNKENKLRFTERKVKSILITSVQSARFIVKFFIYLLLLLFCTRVPIFMHQVIQKELG